MRNRNDLRSIQSFGIDYAHKHFANYKGLLVGSGMGFGKTVYSLFVAHDICQQYPANGAILAVSTKSGVEDAWSNQYKEWQELANLKVYNLDNYDLAKPRIADGKKKLKTMVNDFILSQPDPIQTYNYFVLADELYAASKKKESLGLVGLDFDRLSQQDKPLAAFMQRMGYGGNYFTKRHSAAISRLDLSKLDDDKLKTKKPTKTYLPKFIANKLDEKVKANILNAEQPDLVIVSYANLHKLEKIINKKWAVIIIDEAHYICSNEPTEKTFNRRLVKEEIGESTKVLSLTATPTMDKAGEFFAHLEVLADTNPYGTHASFYAAYFNKIEVESKINRESIKKITKLKNEAAYNEIVSIAKPYFVEFKMHEAGDVPVTVQTVYADLSIKSERICYEIENIGISGVETEYIQNHLQDCHMLIDAENLANMHNTARRTATCGFTYRQGISANMLDTSNNSPVNYADIKPEQYVIPLFDDRKRLLAKVIKEYKDNGNMAIFYSYVHEKVQIIETLRECGYDDSTIVTDHDKNFLDDWNKGDKDFLLLRYQSSAESINAQYGGNIVIKYTYTPDHVKSFQSAGRLIRQGQQKHGFIIQLHLRNSYDDRLEELMLSKKNRALEFKSSITIGI